MAKQQKRKKQPKQKEWKQFGHATYEKVMHELVHFSAKTINSNTPACGVRLSASHQLAMPYVAVSGLEKVPTDYTNTGLKGINATIFAQITAVIDANMEASFKNVCPKEAKLIRALANEILPTFFETGTETIGIRLRQLIIQDAKGNDVAITPLQSAGFSQLLNERVTQKRADHSPENKPYWPRGYLGIGGANPQNVGRWVRAMHQPLFFQAPTENKDLRTAYALHYQGISLRPPPALLVHYLRWRNKAVRMGGGSLPSNAKLRQQEREIIYGIAQAIQLRAATARQQLEAAKDSLPGAQLVTPKIDTIQRGLLLAEQRTNAWRQECAQRIHLEIINTKVHYNGEPQTIGVGQSQSAHWLKIIKEAL